MKIKKSITARKIFKNVLRLENSFGAVNSDKGYIGTVGDGTTSDVIKNYVENQGTKED